MGRHSTPVETGRPKYNYAERGMLDWVRPNNMYGKGGEVTNNGRFIPPASCGL